MTSHSVTVISSALTAITESAASTIAIAGAKGKVFTVTRIAAQAFGTHETAVVGAGGLVKVRNDNVNWNPLDFYTGYNTPVTATSSGFAENKETGHKVNLPLPAGSNITVTFTPYDNQSQKFTLTVEYSTQPFSGKQTKLISGKSSLYRSQQVGGDMGGLAQILPDIIKLATNQANTPVSNPLMEKFNTYMVQKMDTELNLLMNPPKDEFADFSKSVVKDLMIKRAAKAVADLSGA